MARVKNTSLVTIFYLSCRVSFFFSPPMNHDDDDVQLLNTNEGEKKIESFSVPTDFNWLVIILRLLSWKVFESFWILSIQAIQGLSTILSAWFFFLTGPSGWPKPATSLERSSQWERSLGAFPFIFSFLCLSCQSDILAKKFWIVVLRGKKLF